MATLCARPADCFAARAFFEAPLRPTPQRKSPATASLPAPGPTRGRATASSGRQRGRRSPPAAGAGSPPHERAMENVVILRRGERVPPVFAEASTGPTPAEGAGFALAGKDSRGVPAKVHESVVAAKQSTTVAAEKEELVAVAAAERHGADATKPEAVAAAARRTLPQAEEEEAGRAPLSAETAQPAPYAGASFLVAAPDPRALPIPALLLKARGRGARQRIRALDDERAPAPAAAAA